jgi:predicted amidophosphoribosyltransferase
MKPRTQAEFLNRILTTLREATCPHCRAAYPYFRPGPKRCRECGRSWGGLTLRRKSRERGR